jgi:hypothetical protein
MSVIPVSSARLWIRKQLDNLPPLFCGLFEKIFPATIWLRPTGKNLIQMKSLVSNAANNSWDHLEFMLHSSELMPGGSPYFKDTKSIEKLYDDLQELFEFISLRFKGKTLGEFYSIFSDHSSKSIEVNRVRE